MVELQGSNNTGLTNPRYIETNGSGFAIAYGEVSRNSNNIMSVLDLNGRVRPNIRSFSVHGSITSPSIALNICPINTARAYSQGNGQYGTYCQFNSCSGNSCKYGSNGVNYGDFDGDGDEERITGYSSIDINGDGIDDLHKFDIPGGNYRYRISQQGSWLTLPSAGGRILKSFTDINNDGYLDAVMGSSNAQGNLYVHLFNGITFNPPIFINHSVSHQSDVYFADLNNDGYPELGYGRYFYKNNRNNSFSNSIFLDAGAKIYSVQDVNGDGWVDVITRENGKNVKARIRYSTAQEQDKIITFSEVGIDYTVTYLHASTGVYSTHVSSSDIATAVPYTEPGQGVVSYPYKVVTPNRYLVSSVIKSPKGYMPTTYTYRYEEAKKHLRGGGFLGFKTITETENADVVTVTKTTFEQDRLEVAGRPLAVEVQKNGKKVSEVNYQYKQHTREGYSANYYQVYPEQVVDIKFGLGSDVAERIETTTRELDRFGNVLSETSVVSSDIEGAGQFTSTKKSDYLSTNFSESGDNFWKIGAAINLISTLTDNTTNLTRHVNNTYNYDSRGYLTQSTEMSSDYERTDDISTRGKTITNRYSYDQWGNIVSQTIEGTDLPARTSTTQYDNQGLYITTSTNALGHTTTSKFNVRGKLIESVSALKNRTTSFDYDSFGRVISETLPGVDNIKTTQYRLGSQCRGQDERSSSKSVSCVTINSASGGEVRLYFDYAGREVRRFRTSFDGQLIVVDTTWDRNGRKLSVTRPHFFDPRGYTMAPSVRFTYDALDREVTKQEPTSDGGIANFTTAYEGYTTSVTDARGFIRSTVTNVMGYILRKDEPLGAYQTYQYYPDGKLRATIDSNGNTTQIRYDNLGHRSYLNDPDLGQWSYTYNAAGELIYKRDAKGTITTIEYDLLGRKISQTVDGKVSSWRYDERGALGTLSGFSGNGSETDYYYNESGLTEEIAVEVNNEKFSTNYFYDMYERISREVRPNGIVTSLAGSVAQVANINSGQRLAIEYVYNPNGYISAVRSPKNYADDVFTSASFREGIRQLLDQAVALASEYLAKAERYLNQRIFYASEGARYYTKNIRRYYVINEVLLAMQRDGDRFKLYCTDQFECYLRPIKWAVIAGDVSIPLKLISQDKIYRFIYVADYSVIRPASKEEFASKSFTRFDELLLIEDRYGYYRDHFLVSTSEGFVDDQTKSELSFTSNDLAEAESIASSRYKSYRDLAYDLFGLALKVADLSGVYCEYANQLGGNQLDYNQRSRCQNTQESSQADHLALILTQSELEESINNPAYIYYWQRRETDAYDHTLSETLGNGLVNTYNYDANTARPSFITTHKANVLFDPHLSGSKAKGRNLRSIQYRYDSHNNVTYRYDDQLGITDTWQYDALDRVSSNSVSLSNPAEYGVGSPDFAGTFNYQYDNLGNLIFKTGIGDYVYSAQQAGPHAVTKANGLNYQYDANGNMLRARADNSTENERELEWTEFNKPSKITRNGKTVEFYYDANHNRYLKK
ncbi:FG-GAP-like repeat-containing protein, partial [Vibrio sp. M260112]|uniref:FG-GAP-like repeat-containing protein n=1 Tax=Vibrio sp. M260112 TaxID=3020895 RepID=UPI002F3F0862